MKNKMKKALSQIWEGMTVGFVIVLGFVIGTMYFLIAKPTGWVLSAILLYIIMFY